MLSCVLSALYPKVTILFNINFAAPSHQTRHIQWEGGQIFGFFFFLFEKALWVLQCCQPCTFIRSYVDFKDFFLLLFMKKQKQNESIYHVNEYETFFSKFPYIFSKTTLSLYFSKLYKFMKICYNRNQLLSKFHLIIKRFYNFLKSKYKIWISFP